MLAFAKLSTPGISRQSKTFTASGAFTVPSGVTELFVTLVGGGASGGGSNQTFKSGNGGGGGEVYFRWSILVAPGQSIPITIGLGGAAVAANSNTSGNDGGLSSFGSLLTSLGGSAAGAYAATGGAGGGSYTTHIPQGSVSQNGTDSVGIFHAAGGGGGTATQTVTINTLGARGGHCGSIAMGGASVNSDGTNCYPGAGGGSYSRGGDSSNNPTTPSGYGAGGCGAYLNSKGSAAGAPGLCIVEWHGNAV